MCLQGAVDARDVGRLAMKLSDMGCYEVSLGDTTGVGTPASTVQVLKVYHNGQPPCLFPARRVQA